MSLSALHRCQARDGNNDRCTLVGEHQTVADSKGRAAIVHETKASMWSVPIMVVLTYPPEAP